MNVHVDSFVLKKFMTQKAMHNRIATIVLLGLLVASGVIVGSIYLQTNQSRITGSNPQENPQSPQPSSSSEVRPTIVSVSPLPNSTAAATNNLPTQGSATNWKTYMNPDKKISFQHPNWKEDSLPRTSNSLLRSFESPNGLYELAYGELLNYDPNATENPPENKTLKDFVGVYYQGESWLNNTQPTTLGGREALKTPILFVRRTTGAAMEQSVYTFSKDKGYVYGLTMTVNNTTDQAIQSNGFHLLDQILSTFQFIN